MPTDAGTCTWTVTVPVAVKPWRVQSRHSLKKPRFSPLSERPGQELRGLILWRRDLSCAMVVPTAIHRKGFPREQLYPRGPRVGNPRPAGPAPGHDAAAAASAQAARRPTELSPTAAHAGKDLCL